MLVKKTIIGIDWEIAQTYILIDVNEKKNLNGWKLQITIAINQKKLCLTSVNTKVD